jgi:hypothetical protein
MSAKTDVEWRYDARQDDPLTELRIPVVGTVFPQWNYLVSLCINEDPDTYLWYGERPTDNEAKLIRSLIDYERDWYNETWRTRELDARPFDIDGGFNSIALIKRGPGDWAFRRRTWEYGPTLVPFTLQGHRESEDPVDLPALLDRIHSHSRRWDEWKAAHPEVHS